MQQLSKTTIAGFFFLFLGTIELIGCAIPAELDRDFIFISIFLLVSACLHLLLGYGFLIIPPMKRDNIERYDPDESREEN